MPTARSRVPTSGGSTWRTGARRVWGLKPTIEFLIQLGWWWDFGWNPYEKYVQSRIYLGDISPEGGANGSDPVKDHSTHKSGHDVDIFFVRTDGAAQRTSCLAADAGTYDLDQTTKLGKLIVETAERMGLIIGFFYCSDQRVRAQVPKATDFTNHHDHFHVNIVHPSEIKKKR